MHHTLIKMLPYMLAVVFLSCKHQILNDPNQDPNNPQNQPEVSATCSPDTVYFQQQVLPIFISNCSMSGCHDVASHKEGIILTSYSYIMNTGDIRPFSPSSGDVWDKIKTNNTGDRMPPPPMSALTDQQKNAVYTWIMQGALNNSCDQVCDSTVFTFSAAIKPVITNKCQGCHSTASAQGGIDLSSYAGVKARVDDGRLWGSISHLPGYVAMPQGGPSLSACELSKFKNWIAAGAPNN